MNNNYDNHDVPKSLTRRTLFRSAGLVGAVAVASEIGPDQAAAAAPRRRPSGTDLFVDPRHGDNKADGRHGRPREDGEGPVRTLEQARDLAYAQVATAPDTPVNVWLRGGTYRRASTFSVGPHAGKAAVRFRAYPHERPIVSGAQEINGWTETVFRGQRAWQTVVPELRTGQWPIRSLYVDGERRARPRLPKTVNHVLEDGHSVDNPSKYFYMIPWQTAPDNLTFAYADGNINPSWHNLQDVEYVGIRDWWAQRAPIKAVNGATNTCTINLPTHPYRPHQWPAYFFYVENVYEALTEPGEWYGDSTTGTITYLPLPNEQLGHVAISAPRVHDLVVVAGTTSSPVSNVEFDGITFAHTSWEMYTKMGQSAGQTVGAIRFQHARNCSMESCTVRTVGEYAISLDSDCDSIQISRCHLHDLGSGGVKVASRTPTLPNGNATIENCEIHDTGKVFQMGAGVFVKNSGNNRVAHNEIHDLYYTGISVGYSFKFDKVSYAHDNIVEYNDVYDLGKGLLSDLGGIYTLGKQPGTKVRNNRVQRVNGYTTAPAAGLYADHPSSYITFANNIVCDTATGFAFPTMGAANHFENNIIYHPRGMGLNVRGSLRRGGLSPYGVTMKHNIVVVDNVPIFVGASLDPPSVASDYNLLWNEAGEVDDIDVSTPQLVKIVRGSDNTDVPGSTVHVSLADVKPGEFAFADLDAPISLAPGNTYFIVSRMHGGGIPWYKNTPVKTTGAIHLVGPVTRSPGPTFPVFDYKPSSGDMVSGPVNFRYVPPDGGPATAYVTEYTLSTAMRDDSRAFVGMAIQVGAEPLILTSLGRLRPPSWWAAWRAAGLDQHSVVATPRFVNPRRSDFRLHRHSPALRSPVPFQPIDQGSIGIQPDSKS